MMQLYQLPKITKRKKKRLGRGYGSGKGKTAGRGTKGQKARSKVKLGFEGGQLRLIMRLPFIRGAKFKGPQRRPVTINLTDLKGISEGSKVTPELLQTLGLVPEKLLFGVKVLGKGKLNTKLVFQGFTYSSGAEKKILEAGGKIIS